MNIEKVIASIINCKYDLFLIGSRVKSCYNSKSDYDYILIIKEILNEKSLLSISHNLNYSININSQTHCSIKVFDYKLFEEFMHQDYFRFYEYLLSNKDFLIYCNLNFDTSKITLSERFLHKQLVNSLIIQYWWSIISIIKCNENTQYLIAKFKKRITRNVLLYNSLCALKINNKRTKSLLRSDPLYIKINNLSQFNLQDFLDEYFARFSHEKINKYYLYINTINEQFREIHKAINKLNIILT